MNYIKIVNLSEGFENIFTSPLYESSTRRVVDLPLSSEERGEITI
jgi:hypothetical protein